MSPILGIYASQISGHLVTSSYESIATVNVGAGGSSTITFSSIPSTYKHLQLRCLWKDLNNATINASMQLNGDTAANYSYHWLTGDGSSASAAGGGSASNITVIGQSRAGSNVFGGIIIDILDYASTTKNKTVRSLSGTDANGSGNIFFTSGGWYNSSNAINSISLTTNGVTIGFSQYSSFALYGIK